MVQIPSLRPSRKADLASLGDEELVALAMRGNVAAFEAFYDRHSGPAYSLAHRIVGDPGTAEDVTQDAFISIWRSEGGFDPSRGSVRSWTLSIVRNRAIDLIRREGAKRRPKLEAVEASALEQEAGPERTEDEALRRETASEVRGAIAALPAEQFRVVELAYYGGFSHSEIADVLSIPEGTVKGRMRLALKKIRARMAERIP